MRASKAETGLVVSVVAMFMVFVLLCAPVTLAIQLPPHWFRGDVTINGNPAPDGTVVSAKIGGVEYSNTTTISGKYGADGNFYVLSDDPDTSEKEGGVGGEMVEFYVNNEEVANATFSNGGHDDLDLKIGKEPESESEIEKPAKVQGFLVPLSIAIIVVLLVVVIAVFIIRRKK